MSVNGSMPAKHKSHYLGALATAPAQSCGGNVFPGDAEELVLNRLAIASKGRFDEGEIGAIPQAYNATDFLLSKHLRKHEIDSFRRDAILTLTDMALARGRIHVQSDRIEIDMLGDMFKDRLDEFTPHAIAGGEIEYSQEYTNAYRASHCHI